MAINKRVGKFKKKQIKSKTKWKLKSTKNRRCNLQSMTKK